MRWINHITTGLSLLLATGALFFLPAPASWIVMAVFTAIAAYAATSKGKTTKSKFIVRLKGFAWTREDFCRGWLVTGDTGAGHFVAVPRGSTTVTMAPGARTLSSKTFPPSVCRMKGASWADPKRILSFKRETRMVPVGSSSTSVTMDWRKGEDVS